MCIYTSASLLTKPIRKSMVELVVFWKKVKKSKFVDMHFFVRTAVLDYYSVDVPQLNCTVPKNVITG